MKPQSLSISENKLKQKIENLEVLKEHLIFINIFEECCQHQPNKNMAYEKAEERFKQMTLSGFNEELRKYDYAEVFFSVYSRQKNK